MNGTADLPGRDGRMVTYRVEAAERGPDLWACLMSRGEGEALKSYRVSLTPRGWDCECPARRLWQRGEECKHIKKARELKGDVVVAQVDDKAQDRPTETDLSPVSWPEGGCQVRRSASIGRLGRALVKARGAMRPPVKDTDNTFFKSKYADLAAVLESVTGPLLENGLALVQMPCEIADGQPGLCSLLLHTSGEWLETAIRLRPVKADPQSIGSALTYARRYAVQAILGIAAEDDDGNQGSQPPSAPLQGQQAKAAPPKQRPAPQGNGATAKQPAVAARLRAADAWAHAHGLAEEGELVAACVKELGSFFGDDIEEWGMDTEADVKAFLSHFNDRAKAVKAKEMGG